MKESIEEKTNRLRTSLCVSCEKPVNKCFCGCNVGCMPEPLTPRPKFDYPGAPE